MAAPSGFKFQFSGFRPALCALPLAWLWFVLINDLRVEWTVNPQYSYGWAVPFLCIFLLARSAKAVSGRRMTETRNPSSSLWPPASGLCLLALLYAPTRLIQEANPGWRLVSWALAIEVIGLTLCLLRLTISNARFEVRGFSFQFSMFVFPLCFFLVAVPWPTVFEGPLIQSLTRADVNVTTELAGWLGIPAIPRGNVIEVATGMVGIDEACSGIRSFQATLMISLFLGEFYALGAGRRVLCVAAGFLLALLLNLARLMVLVWVAANKGIAAMAGWHDSTGVVILLGCFFALWGFGQWLAPQNQRTEDGRQGTESREQKTENRGQSSVVRWLAFALAAWIVLVETGVEGWYRFHEARLPAAVQWRVDWPVNNVTFNDRDIAPESRQILRFDDGRNAAWQEGDLGWQVIFLHWKPGRAAVRLARNHTPEICLAAAGHALAGGGELQYLNVHGLKMPFRFYQLTDTPQPVFVAYCLWDDRAGTRDFETSYLTYGSRFAPVLAGQRNSGQRSLEVAVTGINDLPSAQTAVLRLLGKIVSPVP